MVRYSRISVSVQWCKLLFWSLKLINYNATTISNNSKTTTSNNSKIVKNINKFYLTLVKNNLKSKKKIKYTLNLFSTWK